MGRGDRGSAYHPQGPHGLPERDAYNPDSKTVVTGSGDHTARLWDTATGTNGRPQGPQQSGVCRGVQSRWQDGGHRQRRQHGQTLGYGHRRSEPFSRAIRITSTQWRSARMARPWPRGAPTGPPAYGTRPPERKASFSRDIRIWSMGWRSARMARPWPPRAATAPARLWEATTGPAPVAILKGHTNTVFAVAFNPDGKTVVTGGKIAPRRCGSISRSPWSGLSWACGLLAGRAGDGSHPVSRTRRRRKLARRASDGSHPVSRTRQRRRLAGRASDESG